MVPWGEERRGVQRAQRATARGARGHNSQPASPPASDGSHRTELRQATKQPMAAIAFGDHLLMRTQPPKDRLYATKRGGSNPLAGLLVGDSAEIAGISGTCLEHVSNCWPQSDWGFRSVASFLVDHRKAGNARFLPG